MDHKVFYNGATSLATKYVTMIACVPHYDDVIMAPMASQITSLTVVYSIVYSDADKKKTSKLRVTGLCVGNSPETGEFPAQMASNAENVSIWWRHHVDHKVSTMARHHWRPDMLPWLLVFLKFACKKHCHDALFRWLMNNTTQWHEPRIFFPSGHCPETAANTHVSTYFR